MKISVPNDYWNSSKQKTKYNDYVRWVMYSTVPIQGSVSVLVQVIDTIDILMYRRETIGVSLCVLNFNI